MKSSSIYHRRVFSNLSALSFMLSGILFSGSAHAAILANYEFAGGALNSTITSPSQYTLTDVAKGAGVGVNASGDAVNHVYRMAGDSGTGTSVATSFANHEYISFKITPASGSGIVLQSLTLTQAFVSGTGTTTGTFNIGIALFSSVTGFANVSNAIPGGTFEDTTSFSFASTPRSIDLSSLGNITTETEFRLYFYDNSGVANRAHRIDDIVLNGTVGAVPEASSSLFVVAAGLLVASRRRRLG